mgnify:CR=1 FL=1
MQIPHKFKYIKNFNPIFCIPIIDKECINLFFKENNKINTQRISKQSKNERCNYLINNYLKYRFSDSKSINETLYRIFLNIEIRPRCKYCGGEATYMGAGNFQRFCSIKCAMNSEEVKQHCKDLLQEKYGVDNVYQLESVKSKIRSTNLEKLGVEMPIQSKTVREKAKQTYLEKYGVENVSQSEYWKEKVKKTNNERYGGNAPACSIEVQNKMRKTCKDRYGKELYCQSEEFKSIWKNPERKQQIKEKEYKTKKNNNSFKKSTPEIKILELLKSNYPDTIYQHSNDYRYPFNCDFYIPSLDLFIEYNGHWTHQDHIFNENNNDDLLALENMKNKSITSTFYKTAIDIWTVRDPLKVKTAKENNLNYLIIWPLDYKNNLILEKIKEFEK